MPSLVEIGQAGMEKMIFKRCQCYFAILQLSPPGKGNGPLIEQA